MDTSIAITDITPDTTFVDHFKTIHLQQAIISAQGTPRITWNNVTFWVDIMEFFPVVRLVKTF